MLQVEGVELGVFLVALEKAVHSQKEERTKLTKMAI
jgi:hypothetical protein